MQKTISRPVVKTPSLTAAIITTALVAGTLDILAAYVTHGFIIGNSKLTSILKFIASGLFGKKAFAGDGNGMVFMGLLLHYIIALLFTLCYFLLYTRVQFLRRSPVVSGLIYGVLVWAMMNFVVLPMTQAPQAPFEWRGALIALVLLIFFIGFPIAIMTHRYYRTKNNTAH